MQEIYNVNPKQPVPPRLVTALEEFLYSIGVDIVDNRNIKKFILSNINLDINAGEIIGLVGASGCGKTTLGKTFGYFFRFYNQDFRNI